MAFTPTTPATGPFFVWTVTRWATTTAAVQLPTSESHSIPCASMCDTRKPISSRWATRATRGRPPGLTTA